jgi:predicted DNA-binding transcriptional regulator AlpA
MRKELENAFELAKTLPADELPRLLGDLAEIHAVAFQRLSTPPPAPTHDELVDVEQAARRLGMSENYLYRHSKRFAFTRRNGRALRFSSAGIDAYLRRAR